MPLGPHFVLGASGPVFWTVLGLSWAPLGRSWGSLGLSWGSLGALLCALGALLGRSLAHLVALERFSAAPGRLGRVPRASRDPFWDDFGSFWGRFGQEFENNLKGIWSYFFSRD